jgi:ABC-2 type transport system ATP-binding protein
MSVLAIRGLQKSFAGRQIVDRLSLSIAPGETYALLGPNGVGKTTILRMVAGLLRPDAGSIMVGGHDAWASPLAAKAQIAWLPDEPLLYDRLSPMEYLQFIAGLWRIPPALARPRAERLLDTLGLGPVANQPCESFSRGMKQKTVLAGALIHEPMLMLLDEPFTGLDAAASRLVQGLLRARLAAGAAILLTTHMMDAAERLADRIGILHDGRLAAEGTLAGLRAGAGSSLEDIFLALTSPAAASPAAASPAVGQPIT